jgi:hypothetical protein
MRPRAGFRPRRFRVQRLESRIALATDFWTGAVDNQWSTPGNWSLSYAPGPGDTADFTSGAAATTANVDTPFNIASLVIDSSWGGAINVSSPLTISGNFQLSSGTFGGDGAVSIAGGASQWTGGTLDIGAGGFVNQNGGTFSIVGGPALMLNGPGSFTNDGAIVESNVADLVIANGGTLANAAGGTFNFTDDGTITQGASTGIFDNSGLVEKTGGTSVSSIASQFNNTGGTIDSESGTISLATAGGTNTGGTLDAGLGGSTTAAIDLTGGNTVAYTGSYSGSGSGTVDLASGTLAVGAGGASFDLTGTLFQWTGGTIDVTSGGTFTNAASGTIDVAGSSAVALNGAGTFTNDGTINDASAAGLVIENGATLTNAAGATVDFTADGAVNQAGVGPDVFNNAGLVEKTGGTGVSYITSQFNNTLGTIDSESGTISLATAGGTNTGGTLDAGLAGSTTAAIDLTGGNTVAYTGSYSGSGTGTVELASGTLAIGAGGASFNLPGTLFQWTGGTIDVTSGGTFTNAVSGTINVAGSSTVALNGAGTFTNDGTINDAANAALSIQNGATLSNLPGGAFNFTSNGNIALGGSGSNVFNNTGLLEKTGGAGTSTIASLFNNMGGTIDSESGTISLATAGGANTGGTFDAGLGGSSTATIDLTGGNTVAYTGSYTGAGSGTVQLASGTLAVGSSGVTLNFPGSLFQWTGGTVDVSSRGTLTNAAKGVISVAGAADVDLDGQGTLANYGTIVDSSTASFDITRLAGLVNEAGATFNFTSDGSVTADALRDVFTNYGLMEKTGGSGVTTLDGPFSLVGGTLDAESGTIDVEFVAGLSTGGAFDAGLNGSTTAAIDFTGGLTTTFQGTYTGSGSGTVALVNGTIAAVGSGATFNFPGNLFQWAGGAIDVNSANLTNSNTINFTSGNLDCGNGGKSNHAHLINVRSFLQTTPSTLTIASNATFQNQGTYLVESDGGIAGGTFLNSGTLEKTQGSGTTIVNSALNNMGTIEAASGTLDLSGAVTQITGNTLNAGSWIVNGTNATAALTVGSQNIQTLGAKATVQLIGANAQWTNLTLSSVKGSLLLLAGESYTTAGDLTVSGKLTLGPGSTLAVGGSYTQASTAALTVQAQVVGSNLSVGTITTGSSGTASLAGKLAFSVVGKPALHRTFAILTAGSGSQLSGTFLGLPEGSTISAAGMKFKISYVGGAGNAVTLTRTS